MGKYKYPALWLVIILMAVSVAGCTGFATNSYKGLEASSLTYDMVMTTSADLYDNGILSETQKDKVIELGRLYQVAHNEYLTAFKAWVKEGRNESGMGALRALQSVQLEKFSIFVDYAEKEGII